MAASTRTSGRSSVADRVGYFIAGVVNAALLYAVNVWPGWRVLPFLTEETAQVLGLVNLSLVVGLVANLIFLIRGSPGVRSLGDLVMAGIGLALLVRVWQVFPFDLHGSPAGLLTRFAVGVAICGTAVGVVVALVSALRRFVAHVTQPG